MLLTIEFRRRPIIRRLTPAMGDYAGETMTDSAGEVYAAVVYVGI